MVRQVVSLYKFWVHALLAFFIRILLSLGVLVAPFVASVMAEEPNPLLAGIDQEVATALAADKMPGCVVLLGRGNRGKGGSRGNSGNRDNRDYRGKGGSRGNGDVLWFKAYGEREKGVPMTTNTVFDLASLTKPVATACSVMQLVERGTLKLDDPVARHLPAFAANGKQAVTIRDLLTHTSGLAPANPLSDFAAGPEAGFAAMHQDTLRFTTGTYAYSDVGFMMLGQIVERASGQSLDRWFADELAAPLGIELGFLPDAKRQARCAPTQRSRTDRDKWMRGEVHDPRAWALNGVAGHAGLFGTASELAVFAQMLLNDGAVPNQEGGRVIKKEFVALMTGPIVVRKAAPRVAERRRALGWDAGPGSSNRSEAYSDRAFGHGGFTGTALWIDPVRDLYVIFLSNRVHPDGKGSVNPLIGRIGSIAVEVVDRED